MNFLFVLLILFFVLNQDDLSKFLGFKVKKHQPELKNKSLFYKVESNFFNSEYSAISAARIRLLMAGIEPNPGPPANLTQCKKCNIKYDSKKINHCKKCCVLYSPKFQHCCKCKKNRNKDLPVMHCEKCCTDYDNTFFHCCCGYSESLNIIQSNPHLQHCDKCHITYNNFETHCCQCKIIWDDKTHTHCCKCNMTYDFENFEHCRQCCFIQDIKNLKSHCCVHKIEWNQETHSHCCKCNIIHDRTKIHCCKCKKDYDEEINIHCEICCLMLNNGYHHCCCCGNIWQEEKKCNCDEIERTFFEIATKELKNKDSNLNFLFSKCATHCQSLIYFKNGIQELGFSSINDFLSDPKNYTFAFHGTPEISGSFDICCESWNLKLRGRHGQMYGAGEYFTTSIETAKQYTKNTGGIIFAIIPTVINNTKIKKVSLASNEIWYVANNDTNSHYAFPIGIIEHIAKLPKIFTCQKISKKNTFMELCEKIKDENFTLYFRGDSGKTQYDKEILQEIILNIKGRNYFFDVDIGNNKYTLDFTRMKQINKNSNYEREIYIS